MSCGSSGSVTRAATVRGSAVRWTSAPRVQSWWRVTVRIVMASPTYYRIGAEFHGLGERRNGLEVVDRHGRFSVEVRAERSREAISINLKLILMQSSIHYSIETASSKVAGIGYGLERDQPHEAQSPGCTGNLS